jgi:hypothetical protein
MQLRPLEERIDYYARWGSAIRSQAPLRPDYTRLLRGDIHDYLGVWYDPIWDLPSPLFQGMAELNIRMGIIANAARISGGGTIAWWMIDWEAVPAEMGAIRELYLANKRSDAVGVQLLTESFVIGNGQDIVANPLSSLSQRFLASIYQATNLYLLPDIMLVYNGSFEAVDRLRDLLNQWSRKTSFFVEGGDMGVTFPIYKYFGLESYIQGKAPYLLPGQRVSLAALIENELLSFRQSVAPGTSGILSVEGNKEVANAIRNTMGSNVLLLFIRVLASMETLDDVPHNYKPISEGFLDAIEA